MKCREVHKEGNKTIKAGSAIPANWQPQLISNVVV